MKTRFSKIALLMVLVLALVVPMLAFSVSAADTEVVFELGANGSASHADGSSKTIYSETVDGYTLSITSGTNMYTGARDAKGNSCIKFGASSKTGSCTFTVPNDVTSVVLNVAKYKANTTKITVNGTTHTLTKNSDDGAYDAITVDTTTTKTVSFTTVSGGVRAMLNSIKFVITDNGGSEEGGCEHNYGEPEVTTPPTCTENGTGISTCSECGDTKEETIEATGHNYDDPVVTPPTCTEEGKTTQTCATCGDEKVTAINKLDHTYENGACTKCGQKEPSTDTAALTFADKDNRTEFSTSKQVWEQNGITFTNNKSASTTNVADYVNPVRLYAGSEVVVEYEGMTQIVFNCNSSTYATDLKNSIGDNATVSSKVVTVDFDTPQNSFTIAQLTKQIRIDSIEITYVKSECDHDYGEPVVTTPATCTENGTVTSTCTKCGDTKEETIKATGHNYGEAVVDEPSCTESGTKTSTCTICGNISTESIPATGHKYDENYVCTVCDYEMDEEGDVTLTFNDVAKRTDWSTEQQVWKENGITVTNDKGQGSNIGDYVMPVRFYKNSVVTVEHIGMEKIVFYCNTTEYATNLQNSINAEGVTVKVVDKVVTIEFTDKVDKFEITLSGGPVRLDSITVSYNLAEDVVEDVVEDAFTNAALMIGEDLSAIFYTTLANGNDGKYSVEFTLCGETFVVNELTEFEDGKLGFVLSAISPEKMAEGVTAVLLYDGVEVARKEGFSVKGYCDYYLTGDGAAVCTEELGNLLNALLDYGNAAEDYIGYKGETLEGEYTAPDTLPEIESEKKNEKADGYEGASLVTEAGVRFAADNKLYLTLTTTEGVVVKVDDVELEFYGNTVYTSGIKATEFASPVVFEIYYNGALAQTVTYSVNSYVAAVMNNGNAGADLAVALYYYGVAASEYKA